MLKLVQTDWGVFDLQFDENAQTDPLIAFSTLVYAALFTDAEADELQMPDRYERRGWWVLPKMGSLIWILRRNALSKKVKTATIANIITALSAYPELSEIEVKDITSQGTVSLLLVSISALYNGVRVVVTVEPFKPKNTAAVTFDSTQITFDSTLITFDNG